MCKVTRVATRTHTVHISAHAQSLSPLHGVDSMAASASVCASAYVSKPVLVQGPFLLHSSVFSSIPGYTVRAVKSRFVSILCWSPF